MDDSGELQRWLPTFEHQLDNESSYDMQFWDFQIKPIEHGMRYLFISQKPISSDSFLFRNLKI